MCKPGTGIPTNSISFFTVTETVIQTRIDEEHLAIFQAYKDGDIEKAVQMMKTHLNNSLNYALWFLPKTF